MEEPGRFDSPALRAVILAVIAFAMLLSLAVPLRSLVRQMDQNQALGQDNAERSARVSELQDRLAHWQDPTFVTEQARQRLHFVYPGETAYIVVGDGRPDTGLIPGPTSGDPSQEGWYARVWDSVEAARG